MSICTNCNGKGYNTVYKGEGGYTDFGPMEYIETTPMGIQKVPCSKCQAKEDKESEKEPAGQTVYEQLQEIQDKIGIKRINEGLETVTDVGYGEHTYSVNKGEYQEGFYPISLSRVLSALGGFTIGVPSYIDENIVLSLKHHTKSNFKLTRKLLNEDGSDAMLDDQSEETIEALHKILVRK